MKKIIYILPAIFIAIIFFAGCGKIIKTQDNLNLDNSNSETKETTATSTTKEVTADKEVKTGDSDIDKEINEIDKVFDSIDSTDLEGDQLKDSEIGL